LYNDFDLEILSIDSIQTHLRYVDVFIGVNHPAYIEALSMN